MNTWFSSLTGIDEVVSDVIRYTRVSVRLLIILMPNMYSIFSSIQFLLQLYFGLYITVRLHANTGHALRSVQIAATEHIT